MLYYLIINYQSIPLIKDLLKHFFQLPSAAYQVVIVNNFSPDQKTLNTFKTDRIHIIEAGENLGFGRACNVGLSWIYKQNPQALIWLLNPDTFCDPQMIAEAEAFFKTHPEISILGTLIYTTDHTIWFAGGSFNPKTGGIISENLLPMNAQSDYRVCDWVSGCSLIINLRQFQDCPQFDANYFLYYEDFDFCQRYQQQGHLIAMTAQISITHQVSAVTNRNLRQKFYHSTYSYLLTLEKYTNSLIFYVRLMRLLIYSLILFPFRRAIALGKITGTWHYFQHKFLACSPLS